MGYVNIIVFSVFKNENGEIEVNEPGEENGYLLEIEVIDKIIESCKRNKKKYPTNEIREAFNAKWQMDYEQKERENYRTKKDAAKQSALSTKHKDCHIYLIQDTIRGFYKIGKAKNYHSRLLNLKTANPCIELVLAFSGIVEDEPFFHNYFSKRGKHIGGEWFELNEHDVDTIISILQEHNREIIYNKLAA